MGAFRQQNRHQEILKQFPEEIVKENTQSTQEHLLPGEMQDDLLRMLFVTCDENIPLESQLVFALKVLCGFSVKEIAHRLFTSDANVYKRLSRARNRLREQGMLLEDLTAQQNSARLPAVNKILYLLFTEGYLSSHSEMSIRLELCNDAIRLLNLLVEHPVGQNSESQALLALMHLHLARMGARQDGSGGLLLLEEQDRSLWDQQLIYVGLEWLARSSHGDIFSRYHAEAGIAAEHCLAPTFAETRWDKIIDCFQLLEKIIPSPLHRLNCAVAVAEQHGPAEGLTILSSFDPPNWLAESYLWLSVSADLHRRVGNTQTADQYRKQAIDSAPSYAVKTLLEKRLTLKTT
jgi:predicted RNA polymerase sigma factor